MIITALLLLCVTALVSVIYQQIKINELVYERLQVIEDVIKDIETDRLATVVTLRKRIHKLEIELNKRRFPDLTSDNGRID